MHDRLLPGEAQQRELQRAWDEREAEDEVEDVGLRREAREGAPLGRLAAHEAARAVERDVGLGVEGVALEDDESRVDAATAERLRERPRHARRVDGAEGDAQRPLRLLAPARPGRSVVGATGRPVPAPVEKPAHVRCGPVTDT